MTKHTYFPHSVLIQRVYFRLCVQSWYNRSLMFSFMRRIARPCKGLRCLGGGGRPSDTRGGLTCMHTPRQTVLTLEMWRRGFTFCVFIYCKNLLLLFYISYVSILVLENASTKLLQCVYFRAIKES